MKNLLYLKIIILLSIVFGISEKIAAQEKDFMKQIMKDMMKEEMKKNLSELTPEISKDTLSYTKGNFIRGNALDENYKNNVPQISENLLKPYTNPKNESGYDPLRDNSHFQVETLHDRMGANMINPLGIAAVLVSLFLKNKLETISSSPTLPNTPPLPDVEKKLIEEKTNELYEKYLESKLKNDSIAFVLNDSIN